MKIVIEGTPEEIGEALRKLSAQPEVKPYQPIWIDPNYMPSPWWQVQPYTTPWQPGFGSITTDKIEFIYNPTVTTGTSLDLGSVSTGTVQYDPSVHSTPTYLQS